jgi:coenzyme F420-reducing hydrogenase beta subunit
MEFDEEGFAYPSIDQENCDNCGLCREICPGLKRSVRIPKKGKEESGSVFALKHMDDGIRSSSASGGAFTAICQAFCDSDYTVFGAKYSEDKRVVHGAIDDLGEIDVFRKSKYVQSDMRDSYESAKDALERGRKVLFTGTPCQVDGLLAYTGGAVETLLCVDFVCHGVPSPILFREYLKDRERSSGARIRKIDFRDKSGYGWANCRISLEFENKQKYSRFALNKDDPYMSGFLSFITLRPSCYACKYANPSRVSDFTIGDFWGVKDILPDFDDNRGCSLLIPNTAKAIGLMGRIGEIAELREVPFDMAASRNGQLVAPAKLPGRRLEFMESFRTEAFAVLKKKFLGPRPLILRLASKIMTEKTKSLIKRALNRRTKE